jgi:Tol biopolymer transport system component
VALSPGTRLGPYIITARLGAGGMGEVYQATDTRLNRTVAIKVLPSHVAADPNLRQRFEREAKTLASLNHPHICSIHDVGEVDGTGYLVMEFVDGDTVADRLRAGALPLDKALAIAIEIAGALDKAHRAGIVHRDVKPANIMLAKGGAGSPSSPHAKLLDFGLAKDRGTVVGGTALSRLPTTPPNATVEGSILGTFPYMAPEQVEGREADARSDIFALGAVLFEMVAGRRAFEGQTHASLMSAILRDTPPPVSTSLSAGDARVCGPGGVHNLDYAVERCLAKDPDERWQSARDLMLHLRWIAEGRARTGAIAAPPGSTRTMETAAWLVAAVALLGVLALGLLALRRSPVAAPVVRFTVDAPAEAVFAPTMSVSAPHPAISPDGGRVAFLAQVGTDPIRIWVRSLDTLQAWPLAGTDGAQFPFWSADSRFLGFFADGSLKTVDTSGGAVLRVCDAPAAEGGTWNRDGTIIFAPGPDRGLHRVSAAGGVSTPVTKPSAAGSAPHRWPSFLPDGKQFVFHEGDTLSLASLDSSEVRPLTKADSQAQYSAAGYLLFVRGTTLLAQPFDAARGVLSGDPRPIAEGVSRALTNAAFTVSPTGVLIYRSGRLVNRQLTWFDRAGTALGSVGGVHDFNGVHLSPDERRVAYHRHDGRPDGDVWLVDLERGTSERFTHSAENLSPVWSPDGTRIAYGSNRDSGVNNVWVKSAAGADADAPLLTSNVNKSPRSWSRDGAFIAYEAAGALGDIWILPLTGDRKPFPFLNTEFDEKEPAFSPDGRWLAYQSTESGRTEIYVRSFPKGDAKWLISTDGGTAPKWRGDGGELFYERNREIWAVTIESRTTGIAARTPHRLFDIGMGSVGWDVARDGQRILVAHGIENRAPGALTVVVNWTGTLRE